ncbi:CD82 antigen-like [Ostrea edulis]|uniref:CD82 antigen-like n=1 Tax=Ostrea edulis TaxID=37623 RepID=UPI0024AF726C|nr:CD82 antigen-like [Ostrea edulis]XP_055995657.1 CD82 antigen-like [Ostrea edulis]
MGDDCCTGFARIILVAFNIIFVLSGGGILGAGIWLKVDPDSVNLQKLVSVDSHDSAISSTAYVLIGFGGFVFLVGVLGCLGGLKRWKWALALYIFFLVVIFLGEFSGGIMAAVYKSKVTKQLSSTLKKSIAEYSNSSIIREAWDAVQSTIHCCGVETYKDYGTYAHYNATLVVPISCCHTGLSKKCRMDAFSNATQSQSLYTEGCLSSLEDQLKSNLTIIIGVAIGIAMIQLLGIVLACKSCRSNDVEVV